MQQAADLVAGDDLIGAGAVFGGSLAKPQGQGYTQSDISN